VLGRGEALFVIGHKYFGLGKLLKNLNYLVFDV